MQQPSAPVDTSATIPFSTNPPAGFCVSNDECVAGRALSFAQATDPAGSQYAVDLIADGVNIPTFPGMTASSTSDAWINTAGVLHSISIEYLTDVRTSPQLQYYSIQVNASAPLVPAATGITLVHGMNPSLVIAVGGSGLNAAMVPGIDRFSVTRCVTASPYQRTVALPVTGVAVTSSAITLQLAGIVNVGDTVTMSYAPLWPGISPYEISAQDANGNLLSAITAGPVTVS
jgi:hypothetical protein